MFQNLIFIFAGLGAGTFISSQSNISVEIGTVGDAGNTNAMLTAFRLPGLLLGPYFCLFCKCRKYKLFLIASLAFISWYFDYEI